MDFFPSYSQLDPDPIFGLQDRFKRDKNRFKHNLSVGVYYDEKGEQLIMKAVSLAASKYMEESFSTSYQPIRGSDAFLTSTLEIITGKEGGEKVKANMAMVQTPGGTSALRCGADFLLRGGYNTMYLSDPTWANHRPIFEEAGMEVLTYPYLDRETMGLDFDGLIRFIKGVKEKSVLLLHTCCHNPTGLDLNNEQWKTVLTLANEKGCLCFFDFAYLGFAFGVDEDCFALRYALEKGYEFLLAFSCSKTFTLYGERVGALMVNTKKSEDKNKVQSHIEQIARRAHSNPPRFGSAIVTTILNSTSLKAQWEEDLAMIRSRTSQTRLYLVENLESIATRATINSLKHGVGFFALLGLTKEQVHNLYDQGIYLTGSSRINLAALNKGNIDHFIKCIAVARKGSQ